MLRNGRPLEPLALDRCNPRLRPRPFTPRVLNTLYTPASTLNSSLTLCILNTLPPPPPSSSPSFSPSLQTIHLNPSSTPRKLNTPIQFFSFFSSFHLPLHVIPLNSSSVHLHIVVRLSPLREPANLSRLRQVNTWKGLQLNSTGLLPTSCCNDFVGTSVAVILHLFTW